MELPIAASRLIFHNEHFFILDKPAGYLSIPARIGPLDRRPCLQTLMSQAIHAPIWVVHRLDAEVSGLLIYARDAAAHRLANSWFEQRLVHKTYEALSVGNPPAEGASALFKDVILKGKKRAYASSFGKAALTQVKYLGQLSWQGHSCCWWRLRPETGRSHQLRFQLASRGFPIVGDSLYGSELPWQAEAGIALKSVGLDFSSCPRAGDFGLPARIELPSLAAALA